jgi:hypothetical protein
MALKNNEDAAFILVDTLDTILSITAEVYAIVERINTSWSPRDSFHYFKKDKVTVNKTTNKKEGFDWDMFTLCTMAVDNGIIEIVSGLLALTLTVKESKLVLGSDGSAVIEAQTFAAVTSGEERQVSTPTPLVKQTGLVLKTVRLAPQVSAFVRNTVTSIQGFTQGDNRQLEEL